MSLMSQIKKRGHESHSEELWIVSYADLMTLLFGFFVILYSFSEINEKSLSDMGSEVAKSLGGKANQAQNTTLESEEARQVRALKLLIAMMNLGDNMEDALKNIEQQADANADLKAMQKDLAKQKSGIQTRGNGLPIAIGANPALISLTIPEHLVFAPGSDRLVAGAVDQLRVMATRFAQHKDVLEIEITGHTDSRPPAMNSKYSDNWSLSSARAGAVAKELERFGVPKSKLIAKGMADAKPLYPELNANGTPNVDNMARNRRVQIVVRMAKYETPN